jgi:hypothetical protein
MSRRIVDYQSGSSSSSSSNGRSRNPDSVPHSPSDSSSLYQRQLPQKQTPLDTIQSSSLPGYRTPDSHPQNLCSPSIATGGDSTAHSPRSIENVDNMSGDQKGIVTTRNSNDSSNGGSEKGECSAPTSLPPSPGPPRSERRHRRANSDDVPREVRSSRQQQHSFPQSPLQLPPQTRYMYPPQQHLQPQLLMHNGPYASGFYGPPPPGYGSPYNNGPASGMIPGNVSTQPGNANVRPGSWQGSASEYAAAAPRHYSYQPQQVPPPPQAYYRGPLPATTKSNIMPPSGRSRSNSYSEDPVSSYQPHYQQLHAPPQETAGETKPLLQKTASDRSLTKRKTEKGGGRRRHRHRKSHSSSAAMPAVYGAFWNGPDAVANNNVKSATNSSGSAPGNFSPRGELMGLWNSRSNPKPDSPRMATNKSSFPASYQDFNQPMSRSPQHLPSLPGVMPSPFAESRGEAVFLAQRKSGKSESSRKRHVRQQSAQLFVEDVKGVEQPKACRDVFFLLLFVFHLIFVLFLYHTYAYAALPDVDDGDVLEIELQAEDDVATDNVTVYYKNLVYISCLCGALTVVLSAGLLMVVTNFARQFVQVSLIVVITLSFVWGTVGIGLSPKNVVPITGVIALALSVAYTFIVWDRIPFAAVNLLTASSGVRAFPSMIILAFCVQALALAYSIFFAITAFGIYDSINDGRIHASERMAVIIYALIGVSFYWTYQVLLNTVQVATSRIIGNWWYQPDGQAVVKHSTFETIFYSMGSICFGSLVVGPVILIRQLSVLFRPNSDEASLLCLHECLHCVQTCMTSCVDSLTESINPWAFTYIGLYGYGFVDSGQQATKLFQKRGWTTIVSDDLIPNVLVMTSLVIGGVTGCFGYLISGMHSLHVLSIDQPEIVSFATGFAIGLAMTSVLLGIIGSSVNAVLVCFASSPLDFERNHPELSHEMRSAWREVWPGALDMVDLRINLGMLSSSGAHVPAV